jgi:hypothetical protein
MANFSGSTQNRFSCAEHALCVRNMRVAVRELADDPARGKLQAFEGPQQRLGWELQYIVHNDTPHIEHIKGGKRKWTLRRMQKERA